MTSRVLSLPGILYLFGEHLLLMLVNAALWIVIDIFVWHQGYISLLDWLCLSRVCKWRFARKARLLPAHR